MPYLPKTPVVAHNEEARNPMKDRNPVELHHEGTCTVNRRSLQLMHEEQYCLRYKGEGMFLGLQRVLPRTISDPSSSMVNKCTNCK